MIDVIFKENAQKRLITATESIHKTLELMIEPIKKCRMQSVTELTLLLKSQVELVEWLNIELDTAYLEELKNKPDDTEANGE